MTPTSRLRVQLPTIAVPIATALIRDEPSRDTLLGAAAAALVALAVGALLLLGLARRLRPAQVR